MTREQLMRLRTDPSHRMTTEEWFDLCDLAEKYMDAKDILGKGPDVLVARELMRMVTNLGETTVGNREDSEEASPLINSGVPPVWPEYQRTKVRYLPCLIEVNDHDHTCAVCGEFWRAGANHECPNQG